MSDTNDILRKLAAQAAARPRFPALERALSSADGRRAVSSLSASHEALCAPPPTCCSGDLIRCPCARTQPRRHSGGLQSSPTPLRRSMGGSSRG